MRNNLLRGSQTEVQQVNLKDDVVLIAESREGSLQATEELLTRYKSLVVSVARQYFLVGAGDEDLIQEGMIALYRAIDAYDLSSKVPFSAFAFSCVKNRIIDVVKAANRDKHKALNNYVSIYDVDYSMSATSAEDTAIMRENSIQVKKDITENLSQEEVAILRLYLDGRSYRDIALQTGKSEKFIDNSLQKIKRKIRISLKKNK